MPGLRKSVHALTYSNGPFIVNSTLCLYFRLIYAMGRFNVPNFQLYLPIDSVARVLRLLRPFQHLSVQFIPASSNSRRELGSNPGPLALKLGSDLSNHFNRLATGC